MILGLLPPGDKPRRSHYNYLELDASFSLGYSRQVLPKAVRTWLGVRLAGLLLAAPAPGHNVWVILAGRVDLLR